MILCNSRSASPGGVGAHKPFPPGASGHGIPNEKLRLERGGVCTLGAEKEKSSPSTVGDRQANPTVCAKSHCHGGNLSCEPAPGAAEKGLARPRGIAQRGKCPLFFLLERRNKRVWWVRRTNDRGSIGPTVFRPRVLGGGWWVPWPPPRARDALSARYWGTRHHEVEKRGARWCSGEHMATGFVGANFCQGGAKERLGVVFRPTVCLLAERGLFGA